MKTLIGLLVAVFLAVGSLVFFAPATLADRRLGEVTNGRLRLADIRGNLWHGEGAVTPADGAWRVPIAWELEPWPLLRGEAVLRLRDTSQGGASQRGRIRVSRGKVRVNGLSITLPAAALAGSDALRLGGDIRVQTPSLSLSPQESEGTLEVTWSGARVAVRGLPATDLGLVRAALAPHDGALVGPIASQGGQVRVAGDVRLASDQAAITATLTPAPDAPPELGRALAALGAADANGAVRVSASHRFR